MGREGRQQGRGWSDLCVRRILGLGGGWEGEGEAQAGMRETHRAGTCEEPGTMGQARQMVEDRVGKAPWGWQGGRELGSHLGEEGSGEPPTSGTLALPELLTH